MSGDTPRTPSTPVEVTRARPEPLYRQLSRALEAEIRAGIRPLDMPLPSTRALALELGLSRNTVSAAYEQLLAIGLIDGLPRRGYFINTRMLQRLPSSTRTQATARPDPPPIWHRLLRSAPVPRTPEITKHPAWEREPFPFVVGQIDERDFPKLAWSRALREALEPPHLGFSVRDAVAADDPALIAAILDHVLPSRGVRAAPENVLLTMGSQQGLDLIAQVLSGPGTVVGVEDPGYVDARHTFLGTGAELRRFPVDRDGIVLPTGSFGVDLLSVTPSHHSPTNVTLSSPRRAELLRRTAAEGVVVIEDDYDSEFRYRGQPSPALRAHDDAAHVVYLGSFTKFLAPGLRLGYIVADAALIRELRRVRRYRIRHVPGHTQRAMALLISSGQYRRTVAQRRRSLGRKWAELHDALGDEFPWSFSMPPGGVSVWVSGPPGFDGVALVARARERGIVIERGDVFFARPEEHRNHVRIGFAAIDHGLIRSGVRALARLIP